jgi:magnesium chelatase family protein
MTQLGLSARAYDKIRRISRTIADIAGVQNVTVDHVLEAISYRLLDRKL